MSENKIQEVKQRADIVKVAQYLGLGLNKHNMCLCPFHKERNASFSISPSKQIFKCFSCDKAGDVITLVQELRHINAYEASKEINEAFQLGVDFGKKTTRRVIKKFQAQEARIKEFTKWEKDTFILLCRYLDKLREWKEIQNMDNDLYVEALMNIDKIEYFIDEVFINGEDEDKLAFWQDNQNLISRIKNRLEQIKQEELKNEQRTF